MDPLTPFFERGTLVLDGGLATTLEAAGHRLDARLWSAGLLRDRPDAVLAVHRSFLEAGADCIATVGYQASFDGFRAAGLSDEAAVGLFERSVALAVEARDRFWAVAENRPGRLRPVVAASAGPYGAYLADGSEYDGRYGIGRADLRRFHERRYRLLAESAADLVAFETVPSALEAEVLLDLVQAGAGAPCWLSFTCADGERIRDGTPVEEVAAACEGVPGVVAIGVNCTAPRHVQELIGRMRAVTTLPILAYPNSGEAYDAVGKRWGPGDAALDLPALAPDWVRAGASGVGGCCRVGPATIRALRDAVS